MHSRHKINWVFPLTPRVNSYGDASRAPAVKYLCKPDHVQRSYFRMNILHEEVDSVRSHDEEKESLTWKFRRHKIGPK